MKKTKRNIAIIVVLLFVCAAIYFNWSYNTQWGKADAEMAAAEDAATAAVKAEENAAAAPREGICRGPARFPLRSQSDCKSQRWTGPRPGYWRIANSSCPSQRALCCAPHGCWISPACRPPGSGQDTDAAPSDSAKPCPGQTSAASLSVFLPPMRTKRPAITAVGLWCGGWIPAWSTPSPGSAQPVITFSLCPMRNSSAECSSSRKNWRTSPCWQKKRKMKSRSPLWRPGGSPT